MIVKCTADIKKFDIKFKKGEYCVVQKINDKILSISDIECNKGFTITKEVFKNNFEYEKSNIR